MHPLDMSPGLGDTVIHGIMAGNAIDIAEGGIRREESQAISI